MAYTTLQHGSRGDEVKKMQQKLIAAGYDLGTSGADGIFGDKTAAAVRSYQEKNNLTADGVAGDQTLTMLYGAAAPEPDPSKTPSPIQGVTKDIYDRINEQYTPSENVQKAWDAIEALKKSMESGTKYSEDLDAIIKKIMDRPAFSYDPETDPLFQQMLASQSRSGAKAMEDTIAKSSALTGGYANSWAQTAGQQTYDQYLQSAYDQLPQYYQLAMNAHNMETEDLVRQYSMLSESDQREFDRLLAQIGVATDMYDRLSKEERLAFEGRVGTAKDIAAMMNSDYWKKIEQELAKSSASHRSSGGYVSTDYDNKMESLLSGMKNAKKKGDEFLAQYIKNIQGQVSSAELSALMAQAGVSGNFMNTYKAPANLQNAKNAANSLMASTRFANMTAREQMNALKTFAENYKNTTIYNDLRRYLGL